MFRTSRKLRWSYEEIAASPPPRSRLTSRNREEKPQRSVVCYFRPIAGPYQSVPEAEFVRDLNPRWGNSLFGVWSRSGLTNKPGWGWQRKKWCKSKATAINLSESHCRGSKINVAFLTRMSWKLRARNSSPWQYRQGPCPIGGINAGIFLWQPIYSNNAAYQ